MTTPFRLSGHGFGQQPCCGRVTLADSFAALTSQSSPMAYRALKSETVPTGVEE
jgi:hypothetical protein